MAHMEDVIRVIRHLNKLGVKAIAKNVALVGNLYYSERHIHRIIKRLQADGRLVKASAKVGYTPV